MYYVNKFDSFKHISMIIAKEFKLDPVYIQKEWSYSQLIDAYSFLVYDSDKQTKEYEKKLNENKQNKSSPKGLRKKKNMEIGDD